MVEAMRALLVENIFIRGRDILSLKLISVQNPIIHLLFQKNYAILKTYTLAMNGGIYYV